MVLGVSKIYVATNTVAQLKITLVYSYRQIFIIKVVTWICPLNLQNVYYLFNGIKHLQKGVPLSKGTTRSITERGTKFLVKLINVSPSATKKAANKCMITRLTELLTVTGVLIIIFKG